MTITNPEFESKINRADSGEFQTKVQSAPELALTPEPSAAERRSAELKDAAAEADRVLQAATVARNIAIMDVVHDRLRTEFPTAATVALSYSYINNAFFVSAIKGADGEALPDTNQAESNVNALLAQLGSVGGAYVGPGYDPKLEEFGDEATIDLTEDRKGRFNPSAALDFDNMPRKYASAIHRDAGYVLGAIPTLADKFEIEYRIEEEAHDNGYDDDTMEKLIAKFGDREKALQAVIDTASWSGLEEQVNDYLTNETGRALNNLNNAIMAALDELKI